jgi:hypothetical protein
LNGLCGRGEARETAVFLIVDRFDDSMSSTR